MPKHIEGYCDLCQLFPEKYPHPFLVKLEGDTHHMDLGGCYRQLFICEHCMAEIEQKAIEQLEALAVIK